MLGLLFLTLNLMPFLNINNDTNWKAVAYVIYEILSIKFPLCFSVKHKDFLIVNLDLGKRVNLRSDVVLKKTTKTASSVFLFLPQCFLPISASTAKGVLM